MVTTAGIAEIGALIGDPSRAAMLMALMDGRALTATELASASGITPQTASGHLGRMVAAGLLAVESQGRHRYHRIASAGVASMIEGIMAVAVGSADRLGVRVRTGPRDTAMRLARSCYDHLAGKVAVRIADRMVERKHLEFSPDGGALTDDGAAFLRSIGVDLDTAVARMSRRKLFCRPCLDWSERRPHIAGAVGVVMRDAFYAQGWMRPTKNSRVVAITPAGRVALDRNFSFDQGHWDSA